MQRCILVIDDDETDVAFLAQAFRSKNAGIAIHHAASGEDGLAFLRERAPDLVLLDLKLPGSSGLEVLAAIRLDERTRRTRVVVLSSSQDRADIRSAYQGAANAFVSKPSTVGGYRRMADSLARFWLDSAMRAD